jgi:hypothetical protein
MKSNIFIGIMIASILLTLSFGVALAAKENMAMPGNKTMSENMTMPANKTMLYSPTQF